MTSFNINQAFVKELEERIPKKSKLADFISETLFIEKESAYRRLRGDVQFSFHEVSLISKKLFISLDNLTGAIPLKSRPFYLKLVDFADPHEIDYEMAEEYSGVLHEIKDDPTTEMGVSAKTLPDFFHLRYSSLTSFYLFRWFYQYGNQANQKKLSEVKPTDRLSKIFEKMSKYYLHIRNVYYVLDKAILKNLIDDIKYFSNIGLINSEDLQKIKRELLLLIDYTEELARKGKNELGNKVEIYLSNIAFDTNFMYIDSQKYKLSIIRAFSLYDVTSLDGYTLEKAKVWVQSLRRTSTLISVSGEIERIKFFNEQRKYVNDLL